MALPHILLSAVIIAVGVWAVVYEEQREVDRRREQATTLASHVANALAVRARVCAWCAYGMHAHAYLCVHGVHACVCVCVRARTRVCVWVFMGVWVCMRSSDGKTVKP